MALTSDEYEARRADCGSKRARRSGTVSESSALEAGVRNGITRRSDRTSWRGASILRPRAVPGPTPIYQAEFFCTVTDIAWRTVTIILRVALYRSLLDHDIATLG
jgi:hypothetical protein